MNRKLQVWGLGLLLVLGGSIAVPMKIAAQDASMDGGRRKVRTKVVPEYPDLAKRMNLTGTVKIAATISPDGRVTSTSTVGGSPVLVNAAVEALKKWRFEPGAKETTEIIEFEFNGQS